MLLLGSADKNLLHRWKEAVEGIGACRIIPNFGELERLIRRDPPAACLVDLILPGLESKEGFARLCMQYTSIPFIALSEIPTREEGVWLLKAGARGYCNRYMHPELLTKAVEVAIAGEVWVGRSLLNGLLDTLPQRQPESQPPRALADLSRREQQVVYRVVRGEGNKQIARELAITERTVKAHMSSIFRKLKVSGRLQLALLVRDSGASLR